MSTNSENLLSNTEMYKIFLLLQSLDEIKRSIIMVLVHIFPKEVSASQIANLAGYSTRSKYIFKSGALEMLEKERIIEVTKPAKRLMLIKLNSENELLIKFSKLCQMEGRDVQELFLGKLLGYE